METVLTFALWAVALIGGLIMAALVLPARLRVRFQSEPQSRFRLSVGLFGGLAPLIPAIDTARRRSTEAHAPAEPKPEKAKKPAKRKLKRLPAKAPRIAAAAQPLASRLLRRIKIERLAVDAWFGLANPADTGIIYGWLTPVLFAAPRSDRISVAARPDFERARFAGVVDGVIRFTPAALALAAAQFAWRAFGPRIWT